MKNRKKKKLLLDYFTTFKKFRSQGLENDPVQLAQHIKTNGVGIITVAFNQFGDENFLAVFEQIRIPTFYKKKFRDSPKSPPQEWPSTTRTLSWSVRFKRTDSVKVNFRLENISKLPNLVNCFCPTAWIQYTSQFGLDSARRQGMYEISGYINSFPDFPFA